MELRGIIENSSLADEDKKLWFLILEKLNHEQTEIWANFIGGQEENLKILTENIKAKRQAFESLDEKALEKIIQNEK